VQVNCGGERSKPQYMGIELKADLRLSILSFRSESFRLWICRVNSFLKFPIIINLPFCQPLPSSCPPSLLNGLSGRRSLGEIENDFLTEEDEVLKGQEHSIGAFITEAVSSGDNHFMGVSWLKRGLCIRNAGVYSRRRGISAWSDQDFIA